MEVEDPYEARLFQMFKSCDKDNCGTLDEKSLRKLCTVLELRDEGSELIGVLLKKDSQISFEIFKEALLNFLTTNDLDLGDNSQEVKQRSLVINDNAGESLLESPPDSSEREVSPKLVVGPKKYGRRSRPQNYVNNLSLSDSDDEGNISHGATVERSSSQTDIPSNRRRRTVDHNESRLKRCVSLPAQRNPQNQVSSGNSKKFGKQLKNSKSSVQKANMFLHDNVAQKQLSSSVESLGHKTLTSKVRDVWSSYGAEIGSNYLTCTQLRIVCERLGLPTALAERVAVESFDQLHSCQYNQLIAVEEFLKLLTGINTAEVEEHSAQTSQEIFYSEDKTCKEAPTQMETLTAGKIIEIWERAGISNGKNILLALGFEDKEVRLEHLNKVIEDEVRLEGLEDQYQLTLLRALGALQSSELSSVRQTLRQVCDENVKLRQDNKEANRRVALMALEIDERHAMLEENGQKEVRLLEQRHSTVIRDLTARMSSDREHWNNLTSKLEARIKTFEQEEIRLKTDLELIRKENDELETEQSNLQKQITELLEQNIKLNQEIANLADTAQGSDFLERSIKRGESGVAGEHETREDEVLLLVEKLSTLQIENHKLRDKNDELSAEVENLSMELQRYKAESKKKSMTTSMTSQLSDSEHGLDDTVSMATKRRGDSPSKSHITEESPRTGKLRKCGTDDMVLNESGHTSDEWIALNTELQQRKDEINGDPQKGEIDVVGKLRRRVNELEDLLKKQQNESGKVSIPCEHSAIIERCKELETSLEQMQAAYEDCEDYWQSKLQEERQIYEKQRQIFEEDQQENDKRFTELMEKVREYEEQYNKDGRLSPIEEKDMLEQQYAHLEAELKAERQQNKCLLEEKTKQIEFLNKEIGELHGEIENLHVRLSEIVTDACEFTNRASVLVPTSQRNNESSASSPISYLWHQSTIQEPVKNLDTKVPEEEKDESRKQSNSNNLSTSEVTTFSTPLPASSTTSTSQQACISPIQKPSPKLLQSDDNGAAGDCDTNSTVSSKSVETQSVTSTFGERSGRERISTPPCGEKQCPTPNSELVRDELKRLKVLEVSLKDQIKDLAFQRDGLIMELQQLQEARPVLEKAYARTAHPNLTQRISQLELKNRHLQNVIKQQQQYSESMMQQSWRQYQTEMNELHGRLDTQVAMLTEQGQRLQNADILVKDLYVENAHLTATVQRLEQQRLRITMMHQQQQQHMHQLQSLNVIPSMP